MFRNRCETDPKSRDSARVDSKNDRGGENTDNVPVGALRRFETGPGARGGPGGGGEGA